MEKETKIDYHKTSQHVPVKIDLTFFNAHCELIEMDYRDTLGQHVHKLPLKKFQLTPNRKPVKNEYKDSGFSGEKFIQDYKKFPGCRVIGNLHRGYKAESVIAIGFRDKERLYNTVRNNNDLTVNLNYKLNSFVLGSEKSFEDIVEYLNPHHPDIIFEMNPAYMEKAHEQGNFVAEINMHVFPVEYKSDFNGEVIDSFKYSYVKNYKTLAKSRFRVPVIEIQLQFLPLKQIYHIKQQSFWDAILRILAKLGGILGVFEVVNYIIR